MNPVLIHLESDAAFGPAAAVGAPLGEPVAMARTALHQELAIGAGVEHTPALELDFIQAIDRAGSDAVHRHFGLQRLQGLANRLLGVAGRSSGKGAGQRQGGGG